MYRIVTPINKLLTKNYFIDTIEIKGINMDIKENIHLDKLINIFDDNNSGYVADKNCLTDDNFLKIVAIEKDEVLGYAVVYPGNDFLQKEGFKVDVELEENLLYIWQCVTKKIHEGKGVQSRIFEYITSNYDQLPIYSVVDNNNIASIKLHNKFKFKDVCQFKKNFHGRDCLFSLLKREI
jgi:hypothetical protein